MRQNSFEEENLNKTIRKKKKKRAIAEEEITETELKKLTGAAHLAPSCFNNQPWRFITVEDAEKLERIKESLPNGNYWAKKLQQLLRSSPVRISIASFPAVEYITNLTAVSQ